MSADIEYEVTRAIRENLDTAPSPETLECMVARVVDHLEHLLGILDALTDDDYEDMPDDFFDESHGRSAYLGSVMQLFPSGKYYTAWTTNQNRYDVAMDAAFVDILEQREVTLHQGEGNATDIFHWKE